MSLMPSDTSTAAVPDATLVQHARSGRREAMEELALRCRQPAYRLALQLLGDPDDAFDVAQDSLLRFFGALQRFDTERPVKPFLLAIVRNRARDLMRRRRLRRHDSLDAAAEAGRPDPVDPAADPAAEAMDRELKHRIWRALGSLSSAQREILVLRDYQDLSYEEIAQVLGVPLGTVMSRLHRARKALKAQIEAQGHA